MSASACRSNRLANVGQMMRLDTRIAARALASILLAVSMRTSLHSKVAAALMSSLSFSGMAAMTRGSLDCFGLVSRWADRYVNTYP